MISWLERMVLSKTFEVDRVEIEKLEQDIQEMRRLLSSKPRFALEVTVKPYFGEKK